MCGATNSRPTPRSTPSRIGSRRTRDGGARETKRFAAKTDTALATISDWITKSEDRRVEETKRLSAQTDTALDAISEWIGKSESQRAEETKRLATSQERVASAVRDALGLMTGRLNQIENLVAEASHARLRADPRCARPARRPRQPHRRAAQRRREEHAAIRHDDGQPRPEAEGGRRRKIDELADARSQDDLTLREQGIAGIEAKLGA